MVFCISISSETKGFYLNREGSQFIMDMNSGQNQK